MKHRYLTAAAVALGLALMASTRPTLPGAAYLDSIDYSDTHAHDLVTGEATSAGTFATKAAPTAPADRYLKAIALSLSAGSGASADVVCRVYVNTSTAANALAEVAPGQATWVGYDGRGLDLSTGTIGGSALAPALGCDLQGTTLGGVRCACSFTYSDERP